MSSDSEFRLLSPAGVPLASLAPTMPGFVRWQSDRKANDIGTGVLTLASDMVLWSWWQRDTRLEHWRSVGAGPLVLEGETIYLLRRRRKLLGDHGERLVELHFVDLNELLDWRDVAYASESAQAAKSGHLDNLAKALVRENLGSLATDTRRVLAGLVIDPDDSAAPTDDLAFARRRVLAVLQDLAAVSYHLGTALFFDLTWTGAVLRFQTYTGARGVDRSGTVTLAPETNTLDACDLDDDWSEEATAIYAVGRGVASARLTREAVDLARAGSSPFGWRERTISAVELANPDSVQAKANAALAASTPIQRFSGRVVDNGDYAVRWRWGDVVAAEFEGDVRRCRIDGRRLVVLQGGAEALAVDLAVVGARRVGVRYPSLNFLAGQSVAEESPVISVTPVAYAIPQAGADGRLASGWLLSTTGENKDSVTISAGQPVAVHSSGSGVVRAAATSLGLRAFGLVIANAAASAGATIQTDGTLTLSDWTAATGGPDLVPRSPYYLATGAGQLTTAAPVADGLFVQPVGYALSARTLEIEVDVAILL